MSTFRSIVDNADERIGDGIERLLCSHHARRLRKLGWRDVLEPGGEDDRFGGRAPLRAGNEMEVLVDGQDALPAIQTAIQGARRSVHIANWYASPDFRLVREPGAPTLRELLAEAAERVPVRVLVWAGPPLPFFHPTRGLVKSGREAFTRGSQAGCVLDSRERTMHCHHEKRLIVDDETAFVGGMDLTALQG